MDEDDVDDGRWTMTFAGQPCITDGEDIGVIRSTWLFTNGTLSHEVYPNKLGKDIRAEIRKQREE